MLKLGRKTATPTTAGPAPSAPKNDAPAKKPAVGATLWRSLLPSIAGSGIAVLLAGGVLYGVLVQQAGNEVTQTLVSNESQVVMQRVVQQLDALHQNSAVVARAPQLQRAIAAGDTVQLQAMADDYREALQATSVRIVLPHQGRKDDTSAPPISFAQLEMIKAAEGGQAPPPEIHRAQDKSYVSLVIPVKQGETTLASLYTAFDFGALRQKVGRLPANIGYLEWIQTFPGTPPLVVTSFGDAGNKVGTPIPLDWGVPHWSLRAYPLAQDNLLASLTLPLALCIGFAAIAVSALGVLGLALVNRQLQFNAQSLAGHFQAMVSRDKYNPKFSLRLFASLADSIERMFHEYDAQVRQQSNNARPEKPTAGTPFKHMMDADDDDPLDISLNGDDNNLLGGSSRAPEALQTTTDDDFDALGLDDIDLAEHEVTLPVEGIPAEIFRAYDIRGIVGSQLTPTITRLIGSAIGTQAIEAGQRSIVVARDGRLSSESLQQSLVEGLVEAGLTVIDIGMVPTPVLYYATHTLETQSGVMVTGSHNPPEYNGFKIVINGITLANQQIDLLRQRIEQGRFARGQGSFERRDILKDYRDRITHDVVLAKPMRIVVDCGNGVGGVIFPEVMDKLGCSVTTLFGEVDGRFPNHHPDPSIASNLNALIEAVRNKNADLGIAIDGDGDRIGIVTKQGQIIWPDRLLMLYARDLLSRNPGADVVYDVKCTRDIIDLVSSLGGRAILSPTGHSLMKAKMRETGALVGGELSGHIFFNDRWYGFDDAIYAAARLLEILSMEPFDIDEVFAEFPARVNTPEIKIPLSEARKFAVVEKLAEQGNFSGGNLVKIDGVRVDYPDGWGLLRASNTTPNLIARFEGDDDAALERVMQRFREQLHNVEPGLSIPF